jgi:hypothetical protein
MHVARHSTAGEARNNFVTCLLHSGFDFCKYCARTNPTWRYANGSEEEGSEEGEGEGEAEEGRQEEVGLTPIFTTVPAKAGTVVSGGPKS